MVKYRNPRHDLETQALEELERIQAEQDVPATTVQEEVWKKRAGDKDRYINQIKAENKAEIEALKNQLDKALRGQIKPPKSNDEIEAWTKEYPEFASILETIVKQRIDEATSKTQAKLSEIEDQQKKLDVKEAVLALKKLHPDFDTLANDKKFHEWLSEQDERYQQAIYGSLNVREADFVIKLYKTEKGTGKPSKVEDDFDPTSAAKVVRKASVAEEPTSDGDYEFSESQVDREGRRNPKWFEQNEPKIMEAIRKGKFLYDLTGGAR